MPKPKHVLVAGGPGTGKTTLVNKLTHALTSLGCRTYVIRDWGREIIEKSLETGSNILPWQDREAFHEAVVKAYINDYLKIYESKLKELVDIVIEDAGAYFTEAYNRAEALPPDDSSTKMTEWAVYVDLVLIVRPLRQYIRDRVRREDKYLALKIHQIIEEIAKSVFKDRVVIIDSEDPNERLRVALRAVKELGIKCLNNASLISRGLNS